MDGSTVDHSDSDSGESWTLLDHSPVYADDAPEFTENTSPLKRVPTETNVEKDEDTDGISVISDSEPETSSPCELTYDNGLTEENHPAEVSNHQYISLNSLSPNINDHHESITSEDDFLGENTGKHKTYVHRRNKRLSTVLNIIMLGSVITAAGVAIGHMWGARNDCTTHTTPSVNKILSNLYKLQEENAYLRSKLKELTLTGTIQLQQRKIAADKVPFKQQRCKKIYEEPLSNKNAERATKCIDNERNVEKLLEKHIPVPEYEKEFISDIKKLKNTYQQNKSWLDEEIAKRIKNEEITMKKMTSSMKPSSLSSILEEQKASQDENGIEPETQIVESNSESVKVTTVNKEPSIILLASEDRKITYADSLKSDQNIHKIQKRETNIIVDKEHREHIRNKKNKKEKDGLYNVISEEELKKDDRYTASKSKPEKKKRDRQKLHKKQKRKNKYEQWEMKGGYLKDYDEFSVTSQDNENIWKKPDKNDLSQDFEKKTYNKQYSDINEIQGTIPKNEKIKPDKYIIKGNAKSNNIELNWFDKRAALRTEARKRLEHELFGETSPNNAGWYFRRMQRREQCRVKADNSTYKKLSKRNMNFKMKH